MSLESMVRLQSVLSKLNAQSRRPHNPHSVLFLDSPLSPLPETTRSIIITHRSTTTTVSAEKLHEQRKEKGAHTYIYVPYGDARPQTVFLPFAYTSRLPFTQLTARIVVRSKQGRQPI